MNFTPIPSGRPEDEKHRLSVTASMDLERSSIIATADGEIFEKASAFFYRGGNGRRADLSGGALRETMQSLV
jgi:hypothetical protein